MREEKFDVVVIGAGPAGLAAAARAAEGNCRVGLVDDNPAPGGQIWREGTQPARLAAAERWKARAGKANVLLLPNTRVVAAPGSRRLLATMAGEPLELRYDRLILATGARERFLPFPGWTLPGVFGAGGLQALTKSGFPVSGRRISKRRRIVW